MFTFFVASRAFGFRQCCGFRVVGLSPYQGDFGALAEVADALSLVEQADPLRYGRLRRYVRRLALAKQRPYIYYSDVGQLSFLRRLPAIEGPRQLTVWVYSFMLIQVATFAYLLDRRFPHNAANRTRVDRLYTTEGARFLAKVPEFDADRFLDVIARLRAQKIQLSGIEEGSEPGKDSAPGA